MHRRAFLVVVAAGVLAGATRLAGAREELPRVVLILTGNEEATRSLRERFIEGMQESGQIDGRTYRLQVMLGEGDPARADKLLRQAAAGKPAVLVVAGLIQARLAREVAAGIPVVVATGGDLVEAGIVPSLARPGGDITGLSDLADEATVKRLELIRAALPRARRVALLSNPDFPATRRIEARVDAAAQRLGLTIVTLHAASRPQLARVLDSFGPEQADALLIAGDSLLTANRAEVIARVSERRVPVIFYWPGTAELGALFSLQPDVGDNFRRAAAYVDKILKGARPGELPIQQPTRYELVVNLKVARTLGLALPRDFLLRADKVVDQ